MKCQMTVPKKTKESPDFERSRDNDQKSKEYPCMERSHDNDQKKAYKNNSY